MLFRKGLSLGSSRFRNKIEFFFPIDNFSFLLQTENAINFKNKFQFILYKLISFSIAFSKCIKNYNSGYFFLTLLRVSQLGLVISVQCKDTLQYKIKSFTIWSGTILHEKFHNLVWCSRYNAMILSVLVLWITNCIIHQLIGLTD